MVKLQDSCMFLNHEDLCGCNTTVVVVSPDD
jgi:hypothetical protein